MLTIVAATFLIGVSRSEAADPASSDLVACYDAERGTVTHIVAASAATLCAGEIVDATFEKEIAAQRARRIQLAIEGRVADPFTGNLRLAGTGSGFLITSAGAALTNQHVINNCQKVTMTPEGAPRAPAEVIAVDVRRDIALLHVLASPRVVATFSKSPGDSDGANLSVAGYPSFGLPTIRASVVTVTAPPTLIATTGEDLLFDGLVRRGHSGSPLLDQTGSIIGMIRAKADIPRIYKQTGRVVADSGLAISQAALLRFLAENKVTPTFSDAPARLSPDQIFERARGFVGQIGCWR